MTRGLKSGTAIIALLAGMGIGFGAAPAMAADLGGDCCADLEERIAELEATTARKGNRKVKLEISGHVNEALIFWDDGIENNVGVYTNDNSRTRFRMKGSAKISDDLKAGYLLEIGVRGANSKRFTQDVPNPADEAGLDVRHSAWYVESKSLGTVWLGRTGPAAEGITEINLANTKDVAKFSDVEDSALGLNLTTTAGTSGIAWRRLIRDFGDQPGETERGQIVKYVTPEFGGFAATAAWGADDYWDIGLNYKGEFAGFKMAAGIAYGQESTEDSDAQIGNCAVSTNLGVDCEQLGGSVSIMHEETGLYTTFGAGMSKDNNLVAAFDGGAAAADDESTFFSIEAGIEKKFFPIGKTTIFGQYYDLDGGSNDRRDLGSAVFNATCDDDNSADAGTQATRCAIAGSELQMYGGGIVQEISAASMLLYVYYRHYEGELDVVKGAGTSGGATGSIIGTNDLNDLDVVVAGGIIKF